MSAVLQAWTRCVQALSIDEKEPVYSAIQGTISDPVLFYVSPFQSWASSLISKVNEANILDDEWLPKFTRGTAHFRGVFSRLRQEHGAAVVFFLQKEVGGMIVLSGFLDAVNSAATLGAPLILHRLLQDMEQISLVWALVIVSLLATLCGRAKDQVCRVQAIWFEGMLRTVLFEKSLLLSPAARMVHPPATIINMSAVDVDFIANYMMKFHDIWSAPLQMIGISVMTVSLMGWSASCGFVLFGIIFLGQSYLGKRMRTSIRSYIQLNDKRLGVLRELLTQIKSVKAVAVEDHYRGVTQAVRRQQLNALWYWLVTTFGIFTAVNQMVPYLTACAAFLTYYLTGHQLSASVVFPSLAYFTLLYQPVTQASLALSRQFAVRPSFSRIKTFLQADESRFSTSEADEKHGPAVSFRDSVFKWPNEIHNPKQLQVGTMSIPRGALTAVIGPNGSGKSSFLQAILGEMSSSSGSCRVYGSVAYAPQDPWLISGTLRDNIIFTCDYDSHRYRQVVRMCGLHHDFQTLPGADQAIIAESGNNLSGGQRARVSLARAIYSGAEVLLLDDPLSAVDAQVRKLLASTLRSLDKTIILVTLHTSYVAQADHIVIFDQQAITWSGSRVHFMDQAWSAKYLHEQPAIDNSGGSLQETSENSTKEAEATADQSESAIKDLPASDIIEEEERAQGSVKWDVVKFYLSSAGGFAQAGVVFALTSIMMLAKVTSQYWFVLWINDSLKMTQLKYVFGYLGLTIGQALLIATLGIVLVFGSMRAGRCIHERVMDNLLSAPLLFFQQHPTGRMLNRLSKDIESVDTKIMNAIDGLIAAGTTLFASVIMVGASGAFMFIVVLPFVIIVGWFLQRFRVTAREVQRSSSILQSPIISILTESLKAPASIKAYDAVQFLVEKHGAAVDRLMSAKIVRRSLDTWITFRAECAAVMVLLVVALCTLYELIPKIHAGLALGVATTLAKNVYLLAWGATDLEIQMNSAERLQKYHDEMPREGFGEFSSGQLSRSWPTHNAIEVKNAFLQFRSRSRPALDHVHLKVVAGEKVGIVGRTGSGKSTLVSVIARLLDLDTGSITVGGTEIKTLEPRKLRKTIVTLPQEPLIFRGTLRQNLDPNTRCTDVEIWKALDVCQMQSFVLDTYGPGALSHALTSDVAEFSAGQRQLLCAARVLLSKPAILLIDEASANIDFATDLVLQRVWQALPVETTMVVIAHRASSLTWMDRIIVMDAGKIVEDESPQQLLERTDPESYYRACVRQDGEEALRQAIDSTKK